MKKATPKFHPQNERIKQTYFHFLKEADQKADSTINGIRKAVLRYENYTGFKDFKTFNRNQAVAFKKHFSKVKAVRSDTPISKSTMLSTINALKAFFKWLAYQPGYKSKIHVPDIEYFNMSEKEVRMAKAPRFKVFPSLEQIRKVIISMPSITDIELRNRALIAFTLLTGMRDGALASLSLKHIDITCDPVLVLQNPNEVDTKFSKWIETYFFPVDDDIREIALDWIKYLRDEKQFGESDPAFPRTKMGQDENQSFEVQGIEPVHWSTAAPICKIFKTAFISAGVRYFSPHLFRDTLAHLGQQICKTPEQLKAWSQNLGHESVLTTFTSYGNIDPHRQGELLKGLSEHSEEVDKIEMILQAVTNQK